MLRDSLGGETRPSWPTFSDPESFYSIQYPPLGDFVVEYLPIPLKTRFGFRGIGDFDVMVETIQPQGLNLTAWLKSVHGIDSDATNGRDLQRLTVNGMPGVVVLEPTAHQVTVYLEQDFFEEPLIHAITFTSYTTKYLYPPFWVSMLHTFQGLPYQP
jgi:hypothetical protein